MSVKISYSGTKIINKKTLICDFHNYRLVRLKRVKNWPVSKIGLGKSVKTWRDRV